MTIAAVILPDNSIAAVLMADATVDAVPPGYAAGAKLLNAPAGCTESWAYDPQTGFTAPPAPAAPSTSVRF